VTAWITAVSIIVVAILGLVGLVLRQRYTTTNARRKTLQAVRNGEAARFRPIATELIGTVGDIRRSMRKRDGSFAADNRALDAVLDAYAARLRAEPDCALIIGKLEDAQTRARVYGWIDHDHLTLLTSFEPQAALKTQKPLDDAYKELVTAVADLEAALDARLTLLATPVKV
jgi:hypothetical protein